MTYEVIDGDLIRLALEGNFNVITHGCNCFCTMGAGIAPMMDHAFDCGHYKKEGPKYNGDMNKLGTIDFETRAATDGSPLVIVNSYTQYGFRPRNGLPALDYDALALCMKKINHLFPDQIIGLPKIGAGLAGGDWERIKSILKCMLIDMHIKVVNYVP